MQINQLAQRTGVSTRALRHYDQRGLLASQRLPNGYRDFPEHSVEQVRRVRLLLDVGLDLSAVALLLPCFADDGRLTGCDRARERLVGQIREIDRSIETMRTTRAMLADELARWDQHDSRSGGH
jgi:DNA-binding transcriptional MerR regulator